MSKYFAKTAIALLLIHSAVAHSENFDVSNVTAGGSVKIRADFSPSSAHELVDVSGNCPAKRGTLDFSIRSSVDYDGYRQQYLYKYHIAVDPESAERLYKVVFFVPSSVSAKLSAEHFAESIADAEWTLANGQDHAAGGLREIHVARLGVSGYSSPDEPVRLGLGEGESTELRIYSEAAPGEIVASFAGFPEPHPSIFDDSTIEKIMDATPDSMNPEEFLDIHEKALCPALRKNYLEVAPQAVVIGPAIP